VARAFGGVLRAARIERGMSQEELAAEAELHRTYPSLLERGLREPTLDVFFRLCAAVHRTPADLLEATLGAAHGSSAARGPSPPMPTPTGRSGESAAAQPPPPIRPHRAHRGPRVREAA